MNVLAKWPSRERPQLFLKTLRAWLAAISGLHRMTFLFSFDAGDVMLEEPQMQAIAQAFVDAANAHPTWSYFPDYIVRVGPKERTKIEACNADINDYRKPWDVLFLISDDMVPIVPEVDREILKCFPIDGSKVRCFDWAINTWDGYRKDELCTFPVMGREYYDRFRYVYHPSYKSEWCDNEWTDVARALGRHIRQPKCFVQHQHPINGPGIGQWDDLYRRRLTKPGFLEDKANYDKRKAQGATTPPLIASVEEPHANGPLLTVMIPTLKEREPQLLALLAELRRQALLVADPSLVEIIFDQDCGEKTIGAKRDRLLKRATGKYVCSIDDDDLIESTYLVDIIGAIQSAPTPPDCVVFNGHFLVDGKPTGMFDFDLAHQCYKQHGQLYMRTPNHLTPILRGIALDAGYDVEKKTGEDGEYARRVYPKLTSQVKVLDANGEKKKLYHYRFSPTLTRTQRPADKRV